ncbi:MAG: RNA polymerase sigma factor [Solirubrobacteraceae bacterium]
MASSEQVLMDRIAAGEPEAFGLLLAPYRAMLLRFAVGRLGGDADLAEDVLQEAMINAYRAIAAGARPEELRAWLFTIVRNCASNARRARRASIPLENHHEADTSQNPALAVAGRERMQLLMGAIGELPDRQRQALLGHVLEGRSYREIATRQESTVSAVKALINRARRNLAATAQPALLPFPAAARRLAGLLTGKEGAKGALAMVAQTLSTATLTAGILMAVPGTGPSPVIASGLPHHSHTASTRGSSHRHHDNHGRPTHAALERRIHNEARGAIAQCLRPTHKHRHYTPAALRYATHHLSTDVIEYTECREQLTRALLHALGGHPHRHQTPRSTLQLATEERTEAD